MVGVFGHLIVKASTFDVVVGARICAFLSSILPIDFEPAGAVVAVACYDRTGWALLGLVVGCLGSLIGIASEAGTVDFALRHSR